MYKGEIISLVVAVSWTICAMFAEVASKRIGSLPFNMLRMMFSIVFLSGIMWWWTGAVLPVGADGDTWLWLSLSGLVGYVLGDFCLFNSYILIGSRYGQLLMTLAPPAAALFGWALLGQQMSWLAIVGMVITMVGIGMALGPTQGQSPTPTLPSREGALTNASFVENSSAKANQKTLPLLGGAGGGLGILFGIGAAMGQGIGLVLSAKGLLHYEEIIGSSDIVFRNGGSVSLVLPFMATFMRAVTGLIGFSIWTSAKGEMGKLKEGLCNLRTMLFALGAVITGPVVGVSLSLMATLYTSTGIAQTIMATTPVMILLPTYLFFQQKVTWREVFGAVISVCGVSLFFV